MYQSEQWYSTNLQRRGKVCVLARSYDEAQRLKVSIMCAYKFT